MLVSALGARGCVGSAVAAPKPQERAQSTGEPNALPWSQIHAGSSSLKFKLFEMGECCL